MRVSAPAGTSLTISASTPQALGAAAAGSTGEVSDAGHIHAMPSASDVGALPASTLGSTDNAVLRANGTGGSTPQASTVTIADDGTITLPNGSGMVLRAARVAWSGTGNTATFTPPGDGVVRLFLTVFVSRTDTGPTYRFSTWQAAFSVSGGTPTRISTTVGGEEELLLAGGYAPSETLDVSGGVITFTWGTAAASGYAVFFPRWEWVAEGLT